MAQRIVTICDAHAAEGAEAPGLTWRVSLVGPESNGRPRTYEVDVCEEHGAAFSALADFVLEVGRPVATDGTAAPVRQRRASEPEGPETERTCPVCGFVSINRKAMRSHVRQVHKTTVGRLNRGEVGEVAVELRPCPECSKEFDTPQGLGVHRFRMHGVTGAGAGAPVTQ